jgi:lysophospholipase L1-like esterase
MSIKTILFQGDSITDAGRSYTDDAGLGSGYPLFVAGRLGMDSPGQWRVINRGISGNRVVDLYARWKIDCLNLKPDVISILIGINDVWHELGSKNGVEADKFERIYGMLLEETVAILPDTRLMVLEPFVLSSAATEAQWAYFHEETALRAKAARMVADEYGAVFVSLQDAFDDAAKLAPAAHWLSDGVHPTPAGHQLIADCWLAALNALS